MKYRIYKQTYSERQAYRYQVTDEADQVCCLAEPTGLFLPTPTRLVTIFDADHNPTGRIEPPPPSPWRLGGTYALVADDQEEPLAVIEERWNLVDLILLRLPRYVLRLGEHTYVARGSRYGERLYEIFMPAQEEEPQEEAGEPEPPTLDEAEMQEALAEGEKRSRPYGESVGEIIRPARGPHYIIEAKAPPLCQAPLVLVALVVVVDMHLHTQPT